MTGNKTLTYDDVDPTLKIFASSLMEKNVAKDIADQLCQSVAS